MAYDITPAGGGAAKTIAADVVGAARGPSSGEQVNWVGLALGTLGSPAGVSRTNPMPTEQGGGTVTSIASAAANTVVKASAGRLCRVLVTTAGSGTGNVLFYDNATTNSGQVIGIVPATIAIGTYYTFDMPAGLGIVVQNVASGPVLAVSWL